MKFDYYYGSQADQFSFIKIPKAIIVEKIFADLSIHAKLLYAILLDRMSLSMKNGWFDEENRVYIIYQIKEIQDDLGYSKRKAMDCLAELVEFGLVEKKKRGFGLPNILYVKSFLIQNDYSRSVENDTSGSKIIVSRSTNICTSEVLKSVPKSSKNDTSEVQESIPLNNKTDVINTDLSNTDSNQIVSVEDQMDGMDKIAFAPGTIYKATEKIVKRQIEYDILATQYPHDIEFIDGMVDLILEAVLSKKGEIVIASDVYPIAMVRDRFEKLNYMHIEYVLECLKENYTKVMLMR